MDLKSIEHYGKRKQSIDEEIDTTVFPHIESDKSPLERFEDLWSRLRAVKDRCNIASYNAHDSTHRFSVIGGEGNNIRINFTVRDYSQTRDGQRRIDVNPGYCLQELPCECVIDQQFDPDGWKALGIDGKVTDDQLSALARVEESVEAAEILLGIRADEPRQFVAHCP